MYLSVKKLENSLENSYKNIFPENKYILERKMDMELQFLACLI